MGPGRILGWPSNQKRYGWFGLYSFTQPQEIGFATTNSFWLMIRWWPYGSKLNASTAMLEHSSQRPNIVEQLHNDLAQPYLINPPPRNNKKMATITKGHEAHDKPLTSPLGTSVLLMSAQLQVTIHNLKSNARHGDLKREHSSRDQGQATCPLATTTRTFL